MEAIPEPMPARTPFADDRGRGTTLPPPRNQSAAKASVTSAITMAMWRRSAKLMIAKPSPTPMSWPGISTMRSGFDQVDARQ